MNTMQNTTKVSHKWLDRSLVISPVFYTIASNKEALKDICEHLNVSIDDFQSIATDAARTTFFTRKDDNGKTTKITAVVYMENDPSYSIHSQYGLIVHEAAHIWQEIKVQLGEDNPSKEFEAYSLQWISQELMTEFDRQIGRNQANESKE